jgi:hypothetical protein
VEYLNNRVNKSYGQPKLFCKLKEVSSSRQNQSLGSNWPHCFWEAQAYVWGPVLQTGQIFSVERNSRGKSSSCHFGPINLNHEYRADISEQGESQPFQNTCVSLVWDKCLDREVHFRSAQNSFPIFAFRKPAGRSYLVCRNLADPFRAFITNAEKPATSGMK